MRLRFGPHRIMDSLRPGPLVDRHYMWARWKQQREPVRGLSHLEVWALIDRGVRGWRPGRYRLAGMRAPLRVVNPAVRFMPVIRQSNEIKRRRFGRIRFYYPWETRRPRRTS